MNRHFHFDSDYMRGAHPAVIERLVSTNMLQTPGYGTDEFTAKAKRRILSACGLDNGDIYFLVGGTQTNATVLDGILGRTEGVLAAETAHINVHEAGAIEATGHKVITLPGHIGKLSADEVEQYLEGFYADESYEHIVSPGAVYISFPTELGTIYSLEELKALSRLCRKYRIPLYLDGARIGYGIVASNDVSLCDIADLCDVFYIGGTKIGALFGEAVVVNRRCELRHFTSLIKQHGALLAKGRLSGLQFEALFTDNLYLEISRKAVEAAMLLRDGLLEAGLKLWVDSPTNQQFFMASNAMIDEMMRIATFEIWGSRGEAESVIRMVTDWATTPEEIYDFLKEVRRITLS